MVLKVIKIQDSNENPVVFDNDFNSGFPALFYLLF